MLLDWAKTGAAPGDCSNKGFGAPNEALIKACAWSTFAYAANSSMTARASRVAAIVSKGLLALFAMSSRRPAASALRKSAE
jgi:hypothetical protein